MPGWRRACFAAGLLVLAGALSPPADTLADQLLLAHMAEHLLIGDVAALLIVLGMTGPLLAPLLRVRGIQWLRVLGHPVVAVVVWAVNFYVWHIPALYRGRSATTPFMRWSTRPSSRSGSRSGWRCSGRCRNRAGSPTALGWCTSSRCA